MSLSSYGNNLGLEGFQEMMNFNDDSLGYNDLLSLDEDNTSAASAIGVADDLAGTKDNERKRSAPLELEEIRKHFDVPITKEAKEMKVGLTILKKRSRELKIMRWPHRKIRSLKSLINNIKVHIYLILG